MKVNEEEAPICQRLIEKYGDDYEMLALTPKSRGAFVEREEDALGREDQRLSVDLSLLREEMPLSSTSILFNSACLKAKARR